MPITDIHTFLVHPGKSVASQSVTGGTRVPLKGKLFDLMREVYDKSDVECDIEISFNKSTAGAQQNPMRDLIIQYAGSPGIRFAKSIADQLMKVTTNRSGLGLLFLIKGMEGMTHKLVISRFPADSGILAEENQQTLSISFLERVFMKNAKAYKAALYRHNSLLSGFWTGHAVDKQINTQETHISNYWISEFLQSDFRTTSAAGTKRLACALRDAIKKTDSLDVKRELAAAVTLASNLAGQRLSIASFGQRVGLSAAASTAIYNEVKGTGASDLFQFDAEEFSNQIAYRTIELDTGGLLTADAREFDNIFSQQVIDRDRQRMRFSTDGVVVDEKVGKRR